MPGPVARYVIYQAGTRPPCASPLRGIARRAFFMSVRMLFHIVCFSILCWSLKSSGIGQPIP